MTIDQILSKIKNDNIKTVIFDFDNTICDLIIDWNPWDAEVGKLLRSYDPFFKKHIPKIPGQSPHIQHLQNQYIRKYGKKLRDKIVKVNREYEEKYASGIHPITRTVALIRSLDAVDLWIWSTNDRKTVRKYLDQLDLCNAFSTFITRDAVDYIKPDPDGFYKHTGRTVNKGEYLMIGNSDSDRGAAKASGIQYIDVSEIKDN